MSFQIMEKVLSLTFVHFGFTGLSISDISIMILTLSAARIFFRNYAKIKKKKKREIYVVLYLIIFGLSR